MVQYRQAPITEAIIEIRYDQPMPRDDLDRLRDRLSDQYEFCDPITHVGVTVDPHRAQAKFDGSKQGFRLSSSDRADILMITSGAMICSRLAPYQGWEKFRPRAYHNWAVWKRVVEYRLVSRIGVRYINRIDIPMNGKRLIRVEDYLTVNPAYPESDFMPGLSGFTMQLTGQLGVADLTLVLNSGAVPSPLVDHFSLLLDIDVLRLQSAPQRDEEIWEMIDLLRIQKNHIFESCVTDASRELFGQ